MIQPSDIARLRELPIEGVADCLGMTVSHHRALCPFHDDSTPSLTFSVSRNNFHCFVCGAHGGTIDLAMKVLGKGFRETCEWLADSQDLNIIPNNSNIRKFVTKKVFDAGRYLRFFEHPFLTDAAMHFLFDERRLDPRVIRWCRINSYRDRNGTNWLQTPYYDADWRLIGVQLRNLGASPSVPRFRFPYGSQCHIYNLPVLKMLRPDEPLYIAEGCSDCWSLLSAGHKAIAIPSATLLKPSDLESITRYLPPGTRLHMYPDRDAPGEKLFQQLSALLPSLVYHELPGECKDFSDYYLTQRRRECIEREIREKK